MSVLKVIAGLGCLVVSLLLGLFTVVGFGWAPLWFTFFSAIFTSGLFAIGLFLILKRHSVLPTGSKLFIAMFVGAIVVSPVLFDLRIRHDRKVLQARANEFLVRPVPKLLVPDSEGNVGDFYVDPSNGPQNGVFGNSRVLIARFAVNGRIRWSARIQGEFASTSQGVNGNYLTDTIRTNEEVRRYFAERNAILGKEWAMGYWQAIEDWIEFKSLPPEFQEEDEDHKFVERCEGSWTNALSSKLIVEPDCTFSLSQSSHQITNSYSGDWITGVGKPSLVLIFTHATGAGRRWSVGDKAEFTILHVDDHKLVYEVDSRTNSMSR